VSVREMIRKIVRAGVRRCDSQRSSDDTFVENRAAWGSPFIAIHPEIGGRVRFGNIFEVHTAAMGRVFRARIGGRQSCSETILKVLYGTHRGDAARA
jgi:hypothetical protein